MREMVHPRFNGAAAMSFCSLSHRSSFSFTIGHFSGTSCPLRTCNSPTGAVECGGESCASAPMVSKAGSGAWIIILAVFCSPKKRLANVCFFFAFSPEPAVAIGGRKGEVGKRNHDGVVQVATAANVDKHASQSEEELKWQKASGGGGTRLALFVCFQRLPLLLFLSSSSLFVLQQNHFHNSCLTFHVCGSMHAQRSRTWPPPSRQQ